MPKSKQGFNPAIINHHHTQRKGKFPPDAVEQCYYESFNCVIREFLDKLTKGNQRM